MYIKIEHYVDRYTFDTVVTRVNENDILEYKKERYKKEVIGNEENPSYKF